MLLYELTKVFLMAVVLVFAAAAWTVYGVIWLLWQLVLWLAGRGSVRRRG